MTALQISVPLSASQGMSSTKTHFCNPVVAMLSCTASTAKLYVHQARTAQQHQAEQCGLYCLQTVMQNGARGEASGQTLGWLAVLIAIC